MVAPLTNILFVPQKTVEHPLSPSPTENGGILSGELRVRGCSLPGMMFETGEAVKSKCRGEGSKTGKFMKQKTTQINSVG